MSQNKKINNSLKKEQQQSLYLPTGCQGRAAGGGCGGQSWVGTATGGSGPTRWCWRCGRSGRDPSSAGKETWIGSGLGREAVDGRSAARRRCRLTYAANGDGVTLLHDVTGLIVLSGNRKTENNMNVTEHRWEVMEYKYLLTVLKKSVLYSVRFFFF